jgi:hypothetical protein
LDWIPWHKAWDKPIDTDREEKGDEIDEQFSSKILPHRHSFSIKRFY